MIADPDRKVRTFFSVDRFDEGNPSRSLHSLIGTIWPLRAFLTCYGWAGRDRGQTKSKFWIDTNVEVGPLEVAWQMGRNSRRDERFGVSASLAWRGGVPHTIHWAGGWFVL